MGEGWKASAFEYLVALRGRLPKKCDFCCQPYTEDRYPVPEEAGDWACNECIAHWARKESRRDA